jgi:hypothetical protein
MASAGHVERFAAALFRLLRLPEAAPLKDTIGDTYLPPLLGLTGPAPKRAADSVFDGRAAEREAARRALEDEREASWAKALREWIARPGT